MTLSRLPGPFATEATTIEDRLSPAQTMAARLPPAEVRAVKAAAAAAGQTTSEWMREAVLLHLKRPARKRTPPPPDATLLAELMGLRSMLQNLMAAATDIPEERIQQIVRHADAVKEAKAEEILKRLELAQAEGK